MVVLPYDPQKPSSPGTFAGRRNLLKAVENALETADRLHRGSALLLHGYRGSGKTSALRKIQAIARTRHGNAAVVEVPLRVPSSEEMLLRSISEAVQSQVESQPNLRRKVERALGSLTGLTVLGTGVERRISREAPAGGLLVVWNRILHTLRGLPLLCLCIDDAELLNAGEVGILKTIIESDSPVPLLVVVAGGPEILERLSRAGSSPILRAFSGAVFDIGQFDERETDEALRAPLRGLGTTTRWDSGAVHRLHHLTHGYPYLVQCFAAAAYRADTRVKESDVEAAIPAALSLAASWLDQELKNASDEDIRTFLKIAGLRKAEFRSSEVLALGVNSLYLGRLLAYGVLGRPARGKYELRVAPAVAYYQALRRGLTAS